MSSQSASLRPSRSASLIGQGEVSLMLEQELQTGLLPTSTSADLLDLSAMPHSVSPTDDTGIGDGRWSPVVVVELDRQQLSARDEHENRCRQLEQRIRDLKDRMFNVRFKLGKPTPTMIADIGLLATKLVRLEDELHNLRGRELTRFEESLQLDVLGLSGVFRRQRRSVSEPTILTGLPRPATASTHMVAFTPRLYQHSSRSSLSNHSTYSDSSTTSSLSESKLTAGAVVPQPSAFKSKVGALTPVLSVKETTKEPTETKAHRRLEQLIEERQQVRGALVALKRKNHTSTSAMMAQLRSKLLEIDQLIKAAHLEIEKAAALM